MRRYRPATLEESFSYGVRRHQPVPRRMVRALIGDRTGANRCADATREPAVTNEHDFIDLSQLTPRGAGGGRRGRRGGALEP